MAIQNVNGRNVYVLTPREATGQTTSGKNWATLYSDLRWQVWEQQQKNEETKMQLELKSFEAKKDYYDQQKKFLQNQISELQKIKAKTGTEGGITISEGLRAIEASSPKSLGGSGASGAKKTVKYIPGYYDPVLEENVPARTITTVTTPLEAGTETVGDQQVTIPGSSGGKTIYKPSGAKEAFLDKVIEGAGAGIKGDTASLDDEITKLEKELAGLTAPQFDIDTDLLARTQRGFERNVGVMGSGGGAFGLASRPRRILPRVDQALAQSRIDELVAANREEVAARDELAQERKDLIRKKAELEAIGLETEEAKKSFEDISDRIDSIDKTIKSPTMIEKAKISPDFVERAPGEFLLKDRTRNIEERGFSGREREPKEKPPKQEQPYYYQQPDRFPDIYTGEVPDVVSSLRERPVGATMPFISPDRRAEMEMLGWQPPVVPAAQPPVIPAAQPTVAPAPQPAPTSSPEPRMEPGATDGATAPIEEVANNAGDLYILLAPQTANMDTGEMNLVPLTNEQKQVIWDKWIKEKETTSTLDDKKAKEWYSEAVKQITGDKGAKKVPATSRQRKDRYAMSVVSEGVKLAEKPKKLERLAKTQADAKSRPQHFVIVDKLYEINKNKQNGFKATYDEISRVFANEPAKRKESHAYLVAKDTLENDKLEPKS